VKEETNVNRSAVPDQPDTDPVFFLQLHAEAIASVREEGGFVDQPVRGKI
jgi:hypothetical protein